MGSRLSFFHVSEKVAVFTTFEFGNSPKNVTWHVNSIWKKSSWYDCLVPKGTYLYIIGSMRMVSLPTWIVYFYGNLYCTFLWSYGKWHFMNSKLNPHFPLLFGGSFQCIYIYIYTFIYIHITCRKTASTVAKCVKIAMPRLFFLAKTWINLMCCQPWFCTFRM